MNSPAAIANLYADTGAAKTRMPFGKLLVLAIFAGAFIALGGLGSSIASCGMPGSVGRVLSGLVFPIGLMMVLVAGAELFTGNCLILISVLEKRATLLGMFRNWGIVYVGNFIGGAAVAALAVYGHTFDMYNGGLAQASLATAMAKVDLPFMDAFIRGILCNVMVCVAVWVSFAASDLAGKVLALSLPVFLFVLCGFEHCIANMYFIPAGIFTAMEYPQFQSGNLSWLSFIINNLLPVTLGNIVGGSVLVGIGYWFTYYSCCRDK